jgi:hypothetical protein
MDYKEFNRQIDWITDTLVEWSKENTAGMPMRRFEIRQLVIDVEEYWGGGWEADDEQIEEFMEEHSEGAGYLVKASDVRGAFIKYEKDFNQK